MGFYEYLPLSKKLSNNASGLKKKIYIAPRRSFLTLAEPASAGTTPGDTIEITSDHTFNFGEGFIEVYTTLDTAELIGELVGDRDSRSINLKLEFFHPGIYKELVEFGDWTRADDFIVLVPLINGTVVQIGADGLEAEVVAKFGTGKSGGGRKGAEFVVESYGKLFIYSGNILLQRDNILVPFSESAVRAFATSTTEATIYLDDVVADSYDYQIATDSGFESVVKSGNVVVKTPISVTGLSADTPYFSRIRSNKSGFATSIWSVIATFRTWPVMPLHYWNFIGMKQATTNAFGRTTLAAINEVYSWAGAANTLTPSTTATLQSSDTFTEYNPRADGSQMSNAKYMALASQISIAGDFTLIARVAHKRVDFERPIIWKADATERLQTMHSRGRVKINNISDMINWAGGSFGLSNLQEFIFVFKRVGSLAYVSNDAGASFATATVETTTILFDRLFADEAWHYSSLFVIVEQDLSAAQLLSFTQPFSQDDYTYPAKVDTPKSITFAAKGGDYYTDERLIPQATASYNRQGAWTRGDYSYMAADKADTLPHTGAEDRDSIILCLKHSTDEIGVGIDSTGTPPEREVLDPHDSGSIWLVNDKLTYITQTDHYDNQKQDFAVIQQTAPNLNFIALTRPPKSNDLKAQQLYHIQYHQYCRSANYECIFGQEWHPGGYARWITMYRSKDNFNTFEKIRIVNTVDSNHWFYYRAVYAEDGTLRLIFNYVDTSATPDVYLGSYYLTDNGTDGETWGSLDGSSFSKKVYADATDGNSISVTELQSQANIAIDEKGAASYSVACFRAFHDPTDGEVYGLFADGEGGINLIYSAAGAWVSKAIDFGGKNIVGAIQFDDPLFPSHGKNVPIPVRRGSLDYTVYLQEVIGTPTDADDNLRIVEFVTDDKGDTWSYVGVISNDDTKRHYRMEASANMHYTGGTTAYNGKKVLIASRDNALTGATYSDVFIKDIS